MFNYSLLLMESLVQYLPTTYILSYPLTLAHLRITGYAQYQPEMIVGFLFAILMKVRFAATG
jgi:hypothetical protein